MPRLRIIGSHFVKRNRFRATSLNANGVPWKLAEKREGAAGPSIKRRLRHWLLLATCWEPKDRQSPNP
jgi:hypothetical protein